MPFVFFDPNQHKLIQTSVGERYANRFNRPTITTCLYRSGSWGLVDKMSDHLLDEIWPVPHDENHRPYINDETHANILEVCRPMGNPKLKQEMFRSAEKRWKLRQDEMREEQRDVTDFTHRKYVRTGKEHPVMSKIGQKD